MEGEFVEPILRPNRSLCLFPIKNPKVWELYKKAEASFWTAEEVDLADDLKDWKSLTDPERHFLLTTLAFFAGSDGLVNENLAENFMSEVQIMEAKCFYGFQIAMENIHNETYSLLIDTYVQDAEMKNHLFNALETVPCVRRKADWARRWMSRDRATFGERLTAFACVEGIFFSGSFCSIFWMKKRGLMNGLCFTNELISRDEGLHCTFACLLFSMLERPPPNERIYEILGDAVEIEKSFVCDALPTDLIGINSRLMCQYIEFVADGLLHMLGVPKLYNATNPFDWMDMISLEGRTNFFERRVSEYSKANVGMQAEDREVRFEEDF